MIRQRALAWAAVLALVATVQIAPLPPQYTVSGAALAQDESASETSDADQPADLAIVALHCAEAPAAEALTSYFADATLPSKCAPAVGVAIAVTENGDPVPGSPFTTDVAGTLTLPVALGSAVTVAEDPKSLPAGYEPLALEANGVPYANPVQLDPAVAGAAVLFVNVPSSVIAELDQGTSTDAGEPTDLTVVALQCDDAPTTKALTSFFSNGTPPSGCAPAAGLTVAVTENDKPLSGSPFRTDTTGTLAVRIGLGSKVTVKEDPNSLPSGYEPLTQEANGVPYANPVQLDSAMDGAAVLFVNVPSSVAAQVQRTSVAEADEPVDLADGVTSNLNASALASTDTPERAGCDPAYPDRRTCIPPGRPLAAPCSITSERNFTVLPPDPRGLDHDGDGIGCEPVGGTVNNGAGFNAYARGYAPFSAPASASNDASAFAASAVRGSDGAWGLTREGAVPTDRRVHSDLTRAGLWFWRPDRIDDGFRFAHLDHSRAGLWFVPRGRIGTGNIAVASNPVVIGNGAWLRPNSVFLGNLTVARSGSGNLAVANNPVVIGHGIWTWPGRIDNDAWFWRARNRADDRHWPDSVAKGVWFWPGNGVRTGNGGIALCTANGGIIQLGDVNSGGNRGNTNVVGNTHGSVKIDGGTVINRTSIDLDANGGYCRADASGGSGNVAIASNPIAIGNGASTWPGRTDLGNDDWRWPNHIGDDLWFWPNRISAGNLTIAGSGNGNVAIASNPIFIGGGLWGWPGHTGDDGWFSSKGVNVGNLTLASSGNRNVAVVSNPIFIGNGLWTWPNRPGNDEWRGRNRFGHRIWGWPNNISVGNLSIAGSGNGNVAIASNPVFISSGVWHWPGHIGNGSWLWPNRNNGHWRWPNHFGKGVWGWPGTISVGNLTIARSGSGNVAIVSNPIVIVNGAWFVPHDRNHDDDWLMRDDRDRAETSGVESLTINGGLVVKSSPASSGQPPADSAQLTGDGDLAQPSDGKIETLTINDGLAVEPSGDGSAEPPGTSSVNPPSDSTAAPPSDASMAPPADAAGQPPDAGAPDAGYVDPGVEASNPAADPGVDPGYVATDPNYVDPALDPGVVAADPAIDPGYVAPEQTYVAPDAGSSPPESSYVDPGYAEPSVEPSYVEPSYADPGPAAADAGNWAPDPGYVAPEPNYTQPEPVFTQDPTYVDPGNVAPDPGIDLSNAAPDPGDFADPGIGPGNVDPGNVAANSNVVAPDFSAVPGNGAPDPSFDAGTGPSSVDLGGDIGGDSGNVAPSPDAGHGDRDRGGDND